MSAKATKSFSQTLNKEPASEETQETNEETVEEQTTTSETQETESTEETEEQTGQETESSEDRKVPLSELLKERDKRKDLERRVAAMEQQNQTTQTTEQTVDKDLDPGGYADQQVNKLAANMNNQMFVMSEVSARNSHKDFDEHYSVGIEHLKDPKNQHLVSGYLTQAHPAEQVYQLGKRLNHENKYGSTVEEQREKIREEERAKIRKEMEDEANERETKKKKQPTDILSQRSASGDAQPDFKVKSFGATQRGVMDRRVRS